MESLFPLIILFGLMWVLLIRPQQRRVRQHQAVVASLVEGDEVVTTGGLIGTVDEINEEVLTVEVAPGVQIKMLRSAVQSRIGGDDEVEELVAEDVDEEPELIELETAAVEELPPASSGELPPAGSGTSAASDTTATADPTATPDPTAASDRTAGTPDPTAGGVPPRRPDAGSPDS